MSMGEAICEPRTGAAVPGAGAVLVDRYQRRIHYLRISVTPRCNLCCRYCRPDRVPAGHAALGDLLSLDEIRVLIETARDLGMDKIRFTGGEPLLRDDIVDIVGIACRTAGIRDVGITTNGVLLPDYAVPLRRAGLRRVNLSLDTLCPARFREITPVGALEDVLAGLEAAIAAGFDTIKLNCVVAHSADEPDARAVAAFAAARGLAVRFIREMDLEAGRFWPVVGGDGGRCERCNRLRVTSTGLVLPCLFSDLAYSLREHGVAAALRLAVAAKPRQGTRSSNRFYGVGG